MRTPQPADAETRSPRAPYRCPRLVVYGRVQALTLANMGGSGMNDMANGPAKTGF